jgi:cysteine desulfurase / selenocysteine lyase
VTPLPRSEFAVTRRYTYLNHAAAGVLPLSSVAAIEAFAREHAEAGVLGTYPHDARLPEYRERIARFIGVRGTQIALLQSTSIAAATIAAGLDWEPGDEVLLSDSEFPANAIPWMALRRRGVNVRLLESAHERLTPDVLRREISPRTRLVTVSWVAYADGFRHDLNGLASVSHDAGALFCVDAMQGLGVLALDAAAVDADAIFAGGPKWLLALHGIAILYLGPRLAPRLELALPGWRSVENIWDFHNYEQPLSRDALRFESGTPNLIGTISLIKAIELLERSGKAQIERHALELTDRLCDGLRRLGAEIATPRGEGVSSAIVTLSLPGCDSIELGRMLEKEGIITTYRASGVRVSPHAYNTPMEIDRLLETLATVDRKRVPA